MEVDHSIHVQLIIASCSGEGMTSRNNPSAYHANFLKQCKKKVQGQMLYHDINVSYCTWRYVYG